MMQTEYDLIKEQEQEQEQDKQSIIKIMKGKKLSFLEKFIFKNVHLLVAIGFTLTLFSHFLNLSLNPPEFAFYKEYLCLFILGLIITAKCFLLSKIIFESFFNDIHESYLLMKYKSIVSALPKEYRKEIFICLLDKNEIVMSDTQIDYIVNNS